MGVYSAFVTKLKAKFDFKSSILTTLVDPAECKDISSSTFDIISDTIPIKFDKWLLN